MPVIMSPSNSSRPAMVSVRLPGLVDQRRPRWLSPDGTSTAAFEIWSAAGIDGGEQRFIPVEHHADVGDGMVQATG